MIKELKNYKKIINENFNIIEHMNSELQELSDLILNCVKNSGHVVFMGVGKNVYLSQKIAATFSSIGIPSYYLDPVHAVHGDLGILYKNDIIISISKSGNTSELINTLNHIFINKERFPQKLIGISCINEKDTCNFDTLCDLSIKLNTENEIDILNKVPSVSLVTIQIVLDCIGVDISNKLGFNSTGFKLNHPGGTIGKSI